MSLQTDRDHLQLFIYRVKKMRALQAEFFNGRRSVLSEAKTAEKRVDDAIRTLTGGLGYSTAQYEAPDSKPKELF
jgi:hypothetical protein